MDDALKRRFVRIIGADDSPRGCGFAISSRQVVTCTHVVAAAVADDGQDITSQAVRFDFPFGDGETHEARVATSWPEDRSGRAAVIEDIAVLESAVDLPVSDNLTLIAIEGAVPTLRFVAFGYLDDPDDDRGAYAYGFIRDVVGGGWVQLDQDGTGVAVQPGFSGGPVWSSDLGGIVGMVVAYDHRDNKRHSKMISARLLAEAIPELRTHLLTHRFRTRPADAEPPSLLIHLCDRGPQEAALRRWSTRPRDPRLPVIFVIEGSDLECHSGFVERLSADLLPDVFSIRDSVQLVDLEWPITALRDGMLANGAEHLLREELAGFPDFRASSPLLISSSILTREWRDGGRAALELFARFWSSYAIAEQRQLFVAIGIRYAERKTKFGWFGSSSRATRRASAAVQELRDRHPSLLAFPPLEPIIRSVVKSWANDPRVAEWRSLSEERVISAYERVPRENWRGDAIPMVYLAEELSALLRIS